MRSRFALVPGAALAVALGLAFAPSSHARPGHRSAHLEHAVEQLALDAETRDAVFAVLDTSRSTGRTLREQLRTARGELRELLEGLGPAEDEVLAKIDVVSALDGEMHKHAIRTQLQVRALLSPEQEEQLVEALRPHRRHRGERSGR